MYVSVVKNRANRKYIILAKPTGWPCCKRMLKDIPLEPVVEGVGDIQLELSFFLQQIDTTTPSSR